MSRAKAHCGAQVAAWLGVFVVSIATTPLDSLEARNIDLDPPAEGQFVVDLAHLVDDADRKRINADCAQLLRDHATPIIVVTISRMSDYALVRSTNMKIETFAQLLFNQWQTDHGKLRGMPWNTAILLLVSEGDHKARIALGGSWGHEKDELCRQIMQGHIVARFKADNFSGGIAAGVTALDRMARGKPLPRPPLSKGTKTSGVAVIGLAIFTAASLLRSGRAGWAWRCWALLFSSIGGMFHGINWSTTHTRHYRHHHGTVGGGGFFGGGGFSGGSFGGGFSGGGGTPGSW